MSGVTQYPVSTDKIPKLHYLHLIQQRGDGCICSKQYADSNLDRQLHFLLWWAELIVLESWLSSSVEAIGYCFFYGYLEMDKRSLGVGSNTEGSCFVKLKSPAASSPYRARAEWTLPSHFLIQYDTKTCVCVFCLLKTPQLGFSCWLQHWAPSATSYLHQTWL